MQRSKRVVVVANRLPVRRNGTAWETSPGGLVSAVTPIVAQSRGTFVGWTGAADDAPPPFEHDGVHLHPVGLSQQEIEDYYLGFSNGTIWPLYHDAIRAPEFHRHWWRPYVDINMRFARATSDVAGPGDIAWIQDYQLQMVPGLLRGLRPDVSIGFFLHIPFPPVEIFARLPWRRQILEGLLGADVLAFQTSLARHNFRRAALTFAGVKGTPRMLEVGDRKVRLMTSPISIDVDHFASAAAAPDVQGAAAYLRHNLGNPSTVILGVDRLDYTKGIDVRLKAFDTMLEAHPEAVENVVFVQVANPSREEVDDYATIREEVEGLVGRINGQRGALGRVPVHYLYGSLGFEELVSWYRTADVMCVTPFRDGMNLVAKEFVATRIHDDGVLILSEFAGAAEEMRQALITNPYDADGLAEIMWRSVTMVPGEQRARMRAMRRQLIRNTVFDWARECIGALEA